MKFHLLFILLLLPIYAHSTCQPDLYGRWESTHARIKTTDPWQDMAGLYWDFHKNGKVEGMLGIEYKYQCNENSILIDTPIKTKFEILNLKLSYMIIKVNEGKSGYLKLNKKVR